LSFNKFKRQSLQDKIVEIVCVLICIIAFIATLYPFYYILVMSFNDGGDALKGGIYLFPRKFTFDNYANFLSDPIWLHAMMITALRTIIGTVLNVLFTCIVAYGLSYQELIFRKFYMLVVIVCMYFSGGLIPYYVTLRGVGLLNNFGVYIIPSMLNLFFVIIAISFYQAIPKELRESAMMDGANDISILLKIILPASMPMIATMSLFIGVYHWNSWLDSAYFVQDNNLRTLGYVMMEVVNKSQVNMATLAAAAHNTQNSTTTQSVQMTAIIVAVGPIICVYPFLQKYFVKGMMLGAVKG
jgi:putative aldouronate transport system permease protein